MSSSFFDDLINENYFYDSLDMLMWALLKISDTDIFMKNNAAFVTSQILIEKIIKFLGDRPSNMSKYEALNLQPFNVIGTPISNDLNEKDYIVTLHNINKFHTNGTSYEMTKKRLKRTRIRVIELKVIDELRSKFCEDILAAAKIPIIPRTPKPS